MAKTKAKDQQRDKPKANQRNHKTRQRFVDSTQIKSRTLALASAPNAVHASATDGFKKNAPRTSDASFKSSASANSLKTAVIKRSLNVPISFATKKFNATHASS